MINEQPEDGWAPIAAQAEIPALTKVIHSIAETISGNRLLGVRGQHFDPGLAIGSAGLGVFHALDADPVDGPSLARSLIERSINAVADGYTEPSLYGGFTGIAWAANYAANHCNCIDEYDLDDIDAALYQWLIQRPWRHSYDLVSGLVGGGVYALERLDSPQGVECIEALIVTLKETAKDSTDGLCWHTSAALLPPIQRQRYPNGYYNLGLAHGVPGIIALLSHILKTGVGTDDAHYLLQGATSWLLSQAQSPDSQSIFLNVQGDDSESRLAWCYGDAGATIALLMAAEAMKDKGLGYTAMKFARKAATRSWETSGVVDAGFCHGSAGLTHIFNRIYQATHDTQILSAARFWLQRTLDMYNPKIEGGYVFKDWDARKNAHCWRKIPAVLTGSAGVGMVLMAAAGRKEPSWDRMFLTDLPTSSL